MPIKDRTCFLQMGTMETWYLMHFYCEFKVCNTHSAIKYFVENCNKISDHLQDCVCYSKQGMPLGDII